MLESILSRADVPELFESLPPSFTFHLARLVLDYVGATNGFNVALWHMWIFPPVWMAECFFDWTNNVLRNIPDKLPTTPIFPPATSGSRHGTLSDYIRPSLPGLSTEWLHAIMAFFCCYMLTGSDLFNDAYCASVAFAGNRWLLHTDFSPYRIEWNVYCLSVEVRIEACIRHRRFRYQFNSHRLIQEYAL